MIICVFLLLDNMSIVMGHGDVYLDGYEIICHTNLGLSNCYSEVIWCLWSSFYIWHIKKIPLNSFKRQLTSNCMEPSCTKILDEITLRDKMLHHSILHPLGRWFFGETCMYILYCLLLIYVLVKIFQNAAWLSLWCWLPSQSLFHLQFWQLTSWMFCLVILLGIFRP